MKYTCIECKDKGYIDTGNNDLPCICAKGKRTLFNSCDYSYPVTGEDLIKNNPRLGPIINPETKEERINKIKKAIYDSNLLNALELLDQEMNL